MPFFMPKGVLSDNYINKKCAVHRAVPLGRTDLMTITNEGQLIRPNNYAYFLNNTIPSNALKKQVIESYQKAIEKAPTVNIVKASLGRYTPDKPGKTTAGYAEEQSQKLIQLQEDKLNTLLNQGKEREDFLKKQIGLLQQSGAPDKNELIGLQNQLFQTQDEVINLERSLGRLQIENNTIEKRNIGLQKQLQKLKSQSQENKNIIDEKTYKIKNLIEELQQNNTLSTEEKQRMDTDIQVLKNDIEIAELETFRLTYQKYYIENFYNFRRLSRTQQISFVQSFVNDMKGYFEDDVNFTPEMEALKLATKNLNSATANREEILQSIGEMFYNIETEEGYQLFVDDFYHKLQEFTSTSSSYETPQKQRQDLREYDDKFIPPPIFD